VTTGGPQCSPWLLALGLTGYGRIAAYHCRSVESTSAPFASVFKIPAQHRQTLCLASHSGAMDCAGTPSTSREVTNDRALEVVFTLPQASRSLPLCTLGCVECDRLSVGSSWRMTRAFVFIRPIDRPFSNPLSLLTWPRHCFPKAMDNSPRIAITSIVWACWPSACSGHLGSSGFWANTDLSP